MDVACNAARDPRRFRPRDRAIPPHFPALLESDWSRVNSGWLPSSESLPKRVWTATKFDVTAREAGGRLPRLPFNATTARAERLTGMFRPSETEDAYTRVRVGTRAPGSPRILRLGGMRIDSEGYTQVTSPPGDEAIGAVGGTRWRNSSDNGRAPRPSREVSRRIRAENLWWFRSVSRRLERQPGSRRDALSADIDGRAV